MQKMKKFFIRMWKGKPPRCNSLQLQEYYGVANQLNSALKFLSSSWRQRVRWFERDNSNEVWSYQKNKSNTALYA